MHETGETMTKLADFKKQVMGSPEFRKEYTAADAEFSVLEALVKARTEAGLTQSELATRLGTTQSAIARLESGSTSPSLATLRKYAAATGKRLEVNSWGSGENSADFARFRAKCNLSQHL